MGAQQPPFPPAGGLWGDSNRFLTEVGSRERQAQGGNGNREVLTWMEGKKNGCWENNEGPRQAAKRSYGVSVLGSSQDLAVQSSEQAGMNLELTML